MGRWMFLFRGMGRRGRGRSVDVCRNSNQRSYLLSCRACNNLCTRQRQRIFVYSKSTYSTCKILRVYSYAAKQLLYARPRPTYKGVT